MVALHQKRVRHYNEPGHFHELTFSCYQRMPLLLNDRFKQMLSVSINNALDRCGFKLSAFVYMPEHVHLLVAPVHSDAAIDRLLAGIKRPVSYRIKKYLEGNDDALLGRLTIRERPGKLTFRFWQEGGGYDRNLINPATISRVADYIHRNPIRHKLCLTPEEWKWSSYRFYHDANYIHHPDLPEITHIAQVFQGTETSRHK